MANGTTIKQLHQRWLDEGQDEKPLDEPIPEIGYIGSDGRRYFSNGRPAERPSREEIAALDHKWFGSLVPTYGPHGCLEDSE